MSDYGLRTMTLDEINIEPINSTMRRRIITGEKLTIAQIWLDKGTIVPVHSHHNEQITRVISGKMEFILGSDENNEGEKRIVSAGELIVLPAHLSHGATVLEDTESWDFFAPQRTDWLDGSDSYLRDMD